MVKVVSVTTLQGVGADAAYQPVVAVQPDEVVVEVVADDELFSALPTPTTAVPVNVRSSTVSRPAMLRLVLIELTMRSNRRQNQ